MPNTTSHVATATVRTALNAVSSAYDTASLAESIFSQLGSLFIAIAASAEPFSQAKKLAGIGSYLADNWCCLHDSQREELESILSKLRALGVDHE